MIAKYEKTRIELLQEWLHENVQVFTTPQKIKLSEFQVDWEKLSGSFNLTLDGVSTKDRIGFSPEVSGKPSLNFPMYHSPLGVPCSYSVIQITWETEYCILKQLKMLLPRVGYHYLENDVIKSKYCDLNRNILDESTLTEIKKKVMDPNLTLEFDMSYDFKV
jgi:hypothetical protein